MKAFYADWRGPSLNGSLEKHAVGAELTALTLWTARELRPPYRTTDGPTPSLRRLRNLPKTAHNRNAHQVPPEPTLDATAGGLKEAPARNLEPTSETRAKSTSINAEI